MGVWEAQGTWFSFDMQIMDSLLMGLSQCDIFDYFIPKKKKKSLMW